MALPALDLTEPDHKFKLGPFVCGIDSHWLDAIHRPGQTIEKDPTLEDLRLILIYLPSRKIWRPLWSVSIVEPDDDHRYLISDDATDNAVEELRAKKTKDGDAALMGVPKRGARSLAPASRRRRPVRRSRR